MNRVIKRAGILLGIFVIAVAAYFIWMQQGEEPDMQHTSFDEAAFPVVSVTSLGQEMNYLHGYARQMDATTMRDTLTVLPDDRQLPIKVEAGSLPVDGISYEVRSLDTTRLVERTELDAWEENEGIITAVLPIQNLLNKDTEYLLSLTLRSDKQTKVYYYTRIISTDQTYAKDILNLVLDFSDKTLKPQESGGLTTYLEPSATEDNSSLGRVTIRSEYAQIIWQGLELTRTSPVYISFKELDGTLATVNLDYIVQRQAEGLPEVYEVTESFTMRWSSQRTYMMDYSRNVNQVFSGDNSLFAGKRIMLGITDGQSASALKSPSKQFTAFVANRELWSYDKKENIAAKLFSFRDIAQDGIRSGYDSHDVKILKVDDEGSVIFMVYGYMNRGVHEGLCGVALYEYQSSEQVLSEKFFIPSTQSFEMIEQDVQKLAHLGSNGMLYLMLDHAVYGVDLKGREYMVVADALTDDSFAVSSDQSMIAWQESTNLLESSVLYLMNLDTGHKEDVLKNDGSLLRTLGFVGSDLVYGMAREQDLVYIKGQVPEIPMYAIEVADQTTEVQTHYEKSGNYVEHVEVDESRIHMKLVSKGGGLYMDAGTDTLICNVEVAAAQTAGIGWYASEERRKLYFVSLESDIPTDKTVTHTVPKKAVMEAEAPLELQPNNQQASMVFYAYGAGRLLGKYTNFSDAVSMAHENMGVVTNNAQTILWLRGNRSTVASVRDARGLFGRAERYIQEFTGNGKYGDKLTIVDAGGCDLSQILYYIDRGMPVAVMMGADHFVLLTGYDKFNVDIYDPASDTTTKMGLNDAAAYFDNAGNDYICWFFTD